ncbi:hypothetical protein BDV96DRAFT_403485 [Lophiotrema nucula]|uniref:BTB domain-containing protein n=1 Tax=Lophiotrema nucula TaxID=690887 RepID=A0A6A5ZF30_9PLEO|nr:hypothetical protein BDV96DRAFT_403485 [Lophiotrema nucula]
MEKNEQPTSRSVSEIWKGPVIIIEVGPDREPYHIHEALLTSTSGYFRGALSSEAFKEKQDGKVTLEDVDTATFSAFASYIYWGALPPETEWGKEFPVAGDEVWFPSDYISRWYVFADRFLVPGMKQIIMDGAHTLYRNMRPRYQSITYAFKNLNDSDSFLRLLVDSYCDNWTGPTDLVSPEDQAEVEKLPEEFLRRAMDRFRVLHQQGERRLAVRNRAVYSKI